MMRFKATVRIVLALLPAWLATAQTAAAQADTLEQLLNRAGASAARFLDKLADVKCNEDVLQEKLNLKGKAEERVQSSFDYLVLAQNQGNEPVLYEAREALKQSHGKKNVSLLVTNGFATQMLVFHPYYQPSFTFERLPDVHVNGKVYALVHFQHVKGRPTPAALLLRGREYPLSFSGTARIDPASGVVEHIETELGASLEDLGLKGLRSEVEYAAVGFPPNATYWLPAQATVEVNTAKQHWKNVHRFTNYHLFSVSTTQSVDLEKLKAKEQ
ncbi:MAG: hypothetical protein LAO20_07510 [Acidobacteriia bacterium]|nr:hypothetical protein [Terriglobia bacterium]